MDYYCEESLINYSNNTCKDDEYECPVFEDNRCCVLCSNINNCDYHCAYCSEQKFILKQVEKKFDDACEICENKEKPVYRLEGYEGGLDIILCERCIKDLRKFLIVCLNYGEVRSV